MNTPVFRPAASLGIVALAAALASCAVGPDFEPPAAPVADGYAPMPLTVAGTDPAALGDAPQVFVAGRDIPAEWWAAFRSPALDALIRRALAASPTLDAARAALRQAQENVSAQRGNFLPTVQADYAPSRERGGNAPYTAPVTYTWQSAALTVGYVPDVFGANRRQVESLQAQAEAQRDEYEAAVLTLTSNLVAAAIQEASLRAQIEASNRMVDMNARALQVVRDQRDKGFASSLALANQQSALAQARQMLPPLNKQLAQTRDLIRCLSGRLPSDDVAEVFTLDDLHLPAELPLSLPSRLVAQRPDILAARDNLHAASAQVGVAVAARLPQLSISASAGGNAAGFAQMFWPAAQFFSLAGNAAQTLFDGGTLQHRQRAAEQGLSQAQAQYRATVLAAFQDVADTLQAIHHDADAYAEARGGEGAAKSARDLTRAQVASGYLGVLDALPVEQAYESALIARLQAQASRLGDAAALFQALGGGWWNATGDSPA